MAAATMLAAGSVGSATGAWNIVTSPNRGSIGGPAAVSCVSATDCMSVGGYTDVSGIEQTLVENWNGQGWTVLPSPNQNTTQDNDLVAVSCTSSTSCMAVGTGGVSPILAERWNGSAWLVTPTPNGVEGWLNSVSCISSTNCMGVGLQYPEGSLYQQTLAERWNGAKWSVLATPNQSTSAYNVLNSVSCTSSTSCTAVGEGPVGAATLVETWNGTAWVMTPSPNPSGAILIFLNGVSCISPTRCTAVGTYTSGPEGGHALVETLNGSTWTIAPGPNPDGGSELNSVSCTTSTHCVAVGYYDGFGYTLVASWNGTAWSVIPNVHEPGSLLEDVSCSSSTSCMAVGGWQFPDVGDAEPLVENWNGGAWTAVSALTPGVVNNLAAVSCSGSTSCAAVGGYNPAPTNTGFQPAEAALMEIWNGSSWLPVYGETDGRAASLNGVSCFSSTDCMAVGSDANPSGVPQTLVDTWNESTGESYAARTASPNRGSESVLTAVSCVSSTRCEAVGYYVTSSGTERTLIESWNGTSWSLAVSPNETTEGNELNSVSCTSASSCVAVGKYGYGPGDTAQAMVESWNGSAWSIIAAPEGGTQSVFNGVSCTSSTSCVAVGDDNAPGRTLIESWHGGVWSVMPHSNGGTLNGVSCSNSTDCVAVGVSGTSQTQVETWNGTRWVSVASSNQADWSNELFGVSCTSATKCTVVGDLIGAGESQTLVETGPA